MTASPDPIATLGPIVAPDRPGFADPVADAQATFRAVLDAMARPGRIHPAGVGLEAPAPLAPATAALLLTLVDSDTPLWLDPVLAPARNWIVFHCAARLVTDPGAAAFLATTTLPPLDRLATGSDEAPEAGASVLLQLPALGMGARYRLAGPGLAIPTTFAATGLGTGFVAGWAANRALFPRGIDLLLCAGTRLAALPRSVSVEAL
ncbi:MAG: phosphonate C-P lyase system protein PhnH [Acetobacteraceae bacterium]